MNKKPIDLSPGMNPARVPAMQAAQDRADRCHLPMHVYVAPPDDGRPFSACVAGLFNFWIVRHSADPAPLNLYPDCELFAVVHPSRTGVLPIVKRCHSPRFINEKA